VNVDVSYGDLASTTLAAAWASSARTDLAARLDRHDTSHGCQGCALAAVRQDLDPAPLRYVEHAEAEQPTVLELDLGHPERGEGPPPLGADALELVTRAREVRLDGDPLAPGFEDLWAALAARPASAAGRVQVRTPVRGVAPPTSATVAALRPALTVRVHHLPDGPTGSAASGLGGDPPALIAAVLEGGGRTTLEADLRRETWTELGEIARTADRWGCDLAVCWPIEPAASRLDTLALVALEDVVASVDRQDQSLAPTLAGAAMPWSAALARLHHLLGQRRMAHQIHTGPPLASVVDLAVQLPRTAPPGQALGPEDADARVRVPGASAASAVRCDLDDRVVWSTDRFLTLPTAEVVGRSFLEAVQALDEDLGVAAPSQVVRTVHPTHLDWSIVLPTHPEATELVGVTVPEHDPAGRLVGTYTAATARRPEPGRTP